MKTKINLYIDNDQWKEINMLSSTRKVSKTEIVRLLISIGLDKYINKNEGADDNHRD